MKPNKKQSALIKSIISVFNDISYTNDINSPTNISDIELFIHNDLDDIIDDKNFINSVIEKITTLYIGIKNLN